MLKKLVPNVIFIIITSFMVLGCGSTDKKQKAWYQVQKSELSFQQSVSNCENELRKNTTDDLRFIAQIAGIQHPIFVTCMMRNGFELRDL